MPGLLALVPQPPARAAEIHRTAQFAVLASASRFIQANISTSLLPCSCAITGTRPCGVPLDLIQPVHRAYCRRLCCLRSCTARPRQRRTGCRAAAMLLGLLHGELAIVEDAGRQHRIGAAGLDAIGQVVQVPTPPEAITGTSTASLTARVSARSKPDLVPSRSMLVSRISPAPRAPSRRAQVTASRPVFLRPPWLYTSHPGPPGCPFTQRCSSSARRRLASMATTMHWAPYFAEESVITCGLAMRGRVESWSCRHRH
jgi:hypothetical protein